MKSQPLKSAAALTGRVLIVLVFLMSAVGNKIPKFAEVSESMAAAGVPMPDVMLVGAIVFLIVGSLLVIAGLKARWGALLLLTFTLLATYYFHDFWTYEDAAAKQQQMIQFMKNLSLMGTMVFLMATGPGPMSLEGRRQSMS